MSLSQPVGPLGSKSFGAGLHVGWDSIILSIRMYMYAYIYPAIFPAAQLA